MSTDKKIPPIQPAPFQKFTVRLVDGHFVRVPKLENIAATDATRPPTVMPPGAIRLTRTVGGPSKPRPIGMRLVNGRFMSVADLAADRASDATGKPPVEPTGANGLITTPRSAAPPPKRSGPPANTEQWALTFGSQIDPSDSPAKS